MGFSRQEYWSGLPFPSPGDLPNPGLEPGLPGSRSRTREVLVFARFSSSPSLGLSCSYDFELADSFPGGSSGKRKKKKNTCQCRRCKRHRFHHSRVRKIPWRRAWQPTPVFLPGESHGQRSLAGYSPGSHRESDMTEAT